MGGKKKNKIYNKIEDKNINHLTKNTIKDKIHHFLFFLLCLLSILITLFILDKIIFGDIKQDVSERRMGGLDKPVIYLYPEEKTDVTVTLDYEGKMFADYPAYNHDINGWEVTALPDSTIFDKSDNKEYSYIFWEGKNYEQTKWNLYKGFVVKGSDTRKFLQNILPKTGMTPKEYNEFIVYWYPLMQENNYNLIHFAGTQYTDLAPLSTEPKFDSMLRVFMVAKPLDTPIEIEPQTFENFERKGFTVVEWGGTLLK